MIELALDDTLINRTASAFMPSHLERLVVLAADAHKLKSAQVWFEVTQSGVQILRIKHRGLSYAINAENEEKLQQMIVVVREALEAQQMSEYKNNVRKLAIPIIEEMTELPRNQRDVIVADIRAALEANQ